MADAGTLLGLPDELILKILDHVDVFCIVRSVSCTCKRLRQLTNTEQIWKKFCIQYWLDETKIHSTESWKENFMAWYERMGRYTRCYAKVKSLWNRIEDTLKERSPTTLMCLNGPVEESVLDAAAETAGRPIPDEIRCSFRIHNGQKVVPGKGSLIGNLEVYDHFSTEVLAPMEFNTSSSFIPGSVVLTWCPFVNYGQAVCLKSIPGLQAGAIFYLNEVGRSRSPFGHFVVASSFLEWLENLANRLADPGLIVENNTVLRFYQEPTCVAITRDVKVTVATAFVPRMSQIRPGRTRTLFAYRITMSMDENAPPNRSCRLMTRHWEITDSTGEFHEVNGEAVIGLYPTIKPGTTFSYASWTPFESEGGFMEGHFAFVNLTTGEKYDVICPRFHMKCPPISMATEDEEEGQSAEEEEDDDDYEDEDEV